MEEHLALWNARLEALAQRASASVRKQFHKELDEWKTAGSAAVAKLAELRTANGESWDAVKLEMETTWKNIEAALGQAEENRRTHDDNAAAKAEPAAPAAESPPVTAQVG